MRGEEGGPTFSRAITETERGRKTRFFFSCSVVLSSPGSHSVADCPVHRPVTDILRVQSGQTHYYYVPFANSP